MRKVIAAMNMTLDGVCDHTEGIADDETHEHYRALLEGVDTMVYGRITFQLMQFWETLVRNPSGDKVMDAFARTIDGIPEKVVFSRTMIHVGWNARIANQGLEEEIRELKKRTGKNILIGSRSLIVEALNLGLVDEFQLCVHPVIVGKGLPLFANLSDRIRLNLLKTKSFGCGVVAFYYEPVK